MQERQANSSPEVTLILEIDSSLSRILNAADPLHEAVRRGILQKLVELLKTLGIPGVPAVQIIALNGNRLPADKVMRVYVNGNLCRYPDELLRHVYSYVCGSHLDPEAKPQKILDWLKKLSDQTETANLDHERLVEFLSLACLEIIKRQPAVLLGLSQLKIYIDSLSPLTDIESGRWLLEPTWLFSILSKVLNLKISIADKQIVVDTLRQAKEKSWEDACEDLIVALRPDVVEIHLPREYLRQLTTVDTENRLSQFPFLRDGLFVELGIIYPTFRFVLVDNFKADSFALKINHLATLPLIGLQPDTCLVNDTSERLKLLNIQASATSNPATGQPGSIIDWSHKGELEGKGLTTWDQMGYIILCFAETLRKNGACFVHRDTVQHQLDQLNLAFPTLVKSVQSNVSLEQITRLLRDLVAEEISIRNMRLILEQLLDYDYSSTGVNLAAFIRTGLKRQISHKYARGLNTLVAYLLDSEIERLLLEHQSSTSSEQDWAGLYEDQRDRILKAIQTEVAHLPPTAMVPNILTSLKVRPALREVLASEFPRIFAAAYEEISPEINVQPIARISLGQ